MKNKRIIYLIALIIIFNLHISSDEGVIRWVCGDYPTAYYKAENGDVKGYLYDIAIEALENRMNIPVEISFLPWARCQSMVRANKADMFLTIPTAERLKYTNTNNTPVWIKKRIVFTYSGNAKLDEINKISGLEDIKSGNYTVISYIGNNWVKSFVEAVGIKVLYSRTIEGMYSLLAKGRGDIIIEDVSLVLPKIKEYNLSDKIIKTEGVGSESAFHIMIGKQSEYISILDELEDVIKEMHSDGTIDQILSSYNID